MDRCLPVNGTSHKAGRESMLVFHCYDMVFNIGLDRPIQSETGLMISSLRPKYRTFLETMNYVLIDSVTIQF